MPKTSYRDLTKLSPEIAIYRRGDSANDNFYVRGRVGSKYFRKSLKTTDEGEARTRAFEAYAQMKGIYSLTGELKTRRLDTWAELVAEYKAHRVENNRSSTWLDRLESVNRNYFQRFFGEIALTDLRKIHFPRYWEWLRVNGSWRNNADKPEVGTIRAHRRYLVALVSFAAELKLVPRGLVKGVQSSVPSYYLTNELTTVKKRGAFTRKQYKKLLSLLNEEVKATSHPLHKLARFRLLVFIKCMRNSLARVSELNKVSYQDFKMVDADGSMPYLSLSISADVSKVNRDRIVPLLGKGSSLFKELQRLKKLSEHEDEDRCFPNVKFTWVEFCRRNKLQLQDTWGRALTLTSIRHYAITHHLVEYKTPVALVARYAGTSVAMIEKTYLTDDLLNLADKLVSPDLLQKWQLQKNG